MANYTVQVALEGKDNLSDPLEKIVDKLDDIEGAVRGGGRKGKGGLLSGFNDLQNGLQNFASTVSGMPLVQLGMELNNIGQQANAAENTFVELSGSSDTANATLELMRASTRGVVDDMTLMSGASRLLLMNLAANGDEASKLTGIAVTLGKAMGQDAATSVGDFASMLANQSIPRLDNFGISSGNVRKRIEELVKAGHSTDEAFKLAVLAEGSLSLERLGTSAEKGASGLEKLQTRLQNIQQDLGQTVSNTVNAAATTVDQIAQIIQIRSGNSAAQVAARNTAADLAKSFSDQYTNDIVQYMGTSFDTTGQIDLWQKAITDTFTLVVNNPQLATNKQMLMDALVGVPDNAKDQFADAIMMTVDDEKYAIAARQINDQRKADNEKAGRETASKYINAFADQWRSTAGNVWGTLNKIEAGLSDTESIEAWKQQQAAIADASSELDTFMNTYSAMSESDITSVVDPTQIGTLNMMLEDAKKQFADLEAMNKNGLISDADLANAQGMVDKFQGMKDKIEAINTMGLKGLLGQDKEDQAGAEMTSMILSQAKEGGLSDAQLEALKSSFEMADGTTTQSSKAMADQVTPMIISIADKYGAEAATIAKQNVETYLREAKLLGMSDDQTASGLGMATGYFGSAGGGKQFTVKPGDSPSEIANKMGMSMEEFLAATGSKNARSVKAGSYTTPGMDMQAMQGFDPTAYAQSLMSDTTVQAVQSVTDNTQLMGQNLQDVVSKFDQVDASTDKLSSNIYDLASKVHVVNIEVKISNMDQLNTLLGVGGGGGGGKGNDTRKNGGKVDGKDGRAD